MSDTPTTISLGEYVPKSELTAANAEVASLRELLKQADTDRMLDAEYAAQQYAKLTSLRAQLAEETAIVSRIWKLLGVETYEQAGGKSIYEIIQERIAVSAAAREDSELLDWLERASLDDHDKLQWNLIGSDLRSAIRSAKGGTEG